LDKERIFKLLQSVAQGEITADKALEALKDLPIKDLGYAQIDTHRSIRQGLPEAIFCPGKTAEQIIAIASQLRVSHSIIVGTKAEADVAKSIKQVMPEVDYRPEAKLLLWGSMPQLKEEVMAVAVLTAGTADIPIAEEAALYLTACGISVKRFYDLGVAGIHRLFNKLPEIRQCSINIVVAGMDGVLPTTLAGIVETPVIAVPTSIGYGASFGGIAALLTMLNSCAAGVTVVNIDNGFGAAVAALRMIAIARNTVKREESESAKATSKT